MSRDSAERLRAAKLGVIADVLFRSASRCCR